MNFIAQVEENLRDLGSEARKKHPGVKEASERAILTLRSLQSRYVSAVRASTSSKNGSSTVPHPTTALFRSQDVLRPFLLACNYPDANSSLLLIGLNAIQLLISGDAVCPEDSVHIARVLGIQAACSCRNFQSEGYSSQPSRGAGGVMASIIGAASSIPTGYYSSSGSGHRSAKDNEAISLKVLQTLTIMVASKELELSEEVLSQAVTVCLTLISGNEHSKDDKHKKKILHRSSSGVTERDGNGGHTHLIGGNNNMRRAAAATLKQILIFAFDRAEGSGKADDKDSKLLKMAQHAAASAFADLCALSEYRMEDDERDSKGLPPRSEVTGPFSVQGSTGSKRKVIQPPPRSACFEMLNMILNHKPSLFMGEVSDEKRDMVLNGNDKDMSDSFAALLRFKACPLVSNFLLSESHGLKGSKIPESSSNAKNFISDQKHLNSREEFYLVMRSTRLACTIIQKFGKCKELANECQILLTALARFVSSASEAYRDTDHFEDGFVYSTTLSTSQRNLSMETNSPIISNTTLWRCALALESLYFLTADFELLKYLHASHEMCKDQTNIVGLIAECVSDFATTAACNKASILSVIRAVSFRQTQNLDDSDKNKDTLYPQIFARARHITKSYDDWESSLNEQNSTFFHSNDAADASSFDEDEIPFCDDGEAIWIAFNCTLSLSSSMHNIALKDTPQIQSLLECSFAPTMAALQHFLKRFPSENYIRNKVLDGFKHLAETCIPVGIKDGLHSEALIKSLCRLSLPNWGKIEANCQLQDHHIETMSVIFDIMHNHHNELSDNWHVILATFEQLSSLSISSSRLSSSSYKTAVAISYVFSRIATFTTCLTPEALQLFVESLVDLSNRASNTTTDPLPTDSSIDNMENPLMSVPDPSGPTISEDDPNSTTSSSLGGKLMSFAGRAFTNHPSTTQDTSKDITEQRVHSSKNYASDFLKSAFTHLAVTKPTTKKDVFRTLPFSLVLVTDVTLVNSFRFSACGKPVTKHLCDLASKSQIAKVRAYAIDTLASLVTSRLSGSGKGSNDNESSRTEAVKEASKENYLVVQKLKSASVKDQSVIPPMSQADLLSPLCQTIADTPAKDAAEAGLNSLYVILESSGHNLSGDAWPILISAISALSGTGPSRDSQSWATCGTLAFRCLKLIVDDFLDQLPVPPSPHANTTRNALLHCCASFGQSQFDVNTSLTATGMLWTIADQDPTPSALENVLAKLAFLACDERAEVRNCSVNTLFSCVVGLGYRFTSEQWKACLEGTIFGVLDQVAARLGKSHKNESQDNASSAIPSRYRVSVHHSRDSNSKQWCATQVLTLRGIERVLRQFFSKLLALDIDTENSQTWFESAWEKIVELAFVSANASGGRDTMELRIAGVDILILCCQLSCEAGIEAAATPVRVGTNMQVVNGALRSVDNKPTNQSEKLDLDHEDLPYIHVEKIKSTRKSLFLKAFAVLERFTDILYHREEEEEQNSYFSEPSILQVLTKLSQGLTKLYECCRDKELAPNSAVNYTICSQVQKSDLEGRMVNMINSVAIHAIGDFNSKYLTLAQRSCLELLRNMCAFGSARAFERLAVMGRKSFFWRLGAPVDDETMDMDDSHSAFELLEFEAAKNAADAFIKEGVSHTSKAVVLSMILKSFLEHKSQINHSETNEEKSEPDGSDSYALLILVVRGGLEAAFFMEKEIHKLQEKGNEKDTEILQSLEKNSNLLKDLWNRTISTLLAMLSPGGNNASDVFVQHTVAILEILSSCTLHVPEWCHVNLGDVLSKGAIHAIEVAKIQSSIDKNESKSCMDCLRVFESCYVGLGKCDPSSRALRSITENYLRETLASFLPRDGGKQPNSSYMNDDKVHVEIEVALIICEGLRTASSRLTDLVIVIFPWLCKLTNIGEERIRQKAGSVLGSVDLVRVIAKKTERVEDAERRANEAELQNKKLQAELFCLKAENQDLRQKLSSIDKE